MFRVIIIDDEPWSRKVIKQLGEWDRFHLVIVGEAEDGTQALRMIEELQPDIIVTDMRMPGIDGVELLKVLNERYSSLKIIVMSGYDDFAFLKQAIRSRAKEYMLKPVDPEELNAALARCVRELQEAKHKPVLSWKTSIIFTNADSHETYLEHRHLIYGYLMDLNMDGVKQTLHALQLFLEHIESAAIEGMLYEIGEDFNQMLQEYVATTDLEWNRMEAEQTQGQSQDMFWYSVGGTIGEIGQSYNRVIESLKVMRNNKNKLDMQEVMDYINRHYNELITLESIADHFHISREHLSRAFKSFSGDTITDHINCKRMEKAKEMIVEHKLAIKHVAELMGYTDLAYFYRVFKKHHGLAPGEIRKVKDIE